MPEQELRVKVNCDTLLEPVAEWAEEARKGELYINNRGEVVTAETHQYFCRLGLIVTPKEPEVSEPKYTIPVEVSKSVCERYSGGIWREPKPGEIIVSQVFGVSTASPNERHQKYIVLTPRVQPYEFPQELRVPGVYGIAANSGWNFWLYSKKPTLASCYYWCGGQQTKWADIQHLFPTVQMPTPEQCHNDWKQSLFVNPDWKAE